MRKLELYAIFPKPKTSKPGEVPRNYPYLLQAMVINRPNQVWRTLMKSLCVENLICNQFPINDRSGSLYTIKESTLHSVTALTSWLLKLSLLKSKQLRKYYQFTRLSF